ncbi:MAG TPA: response regulator transcription factor [Candidatus Cybelea sp.]|nr:response regulator transcription factor [Candidatus Cybelea sp.]
MPSVRVLIADDHAVVRLGLRSLLSQKQGWQVCGEASDGETAVARVCELAPDVVILDLTMPGLNGFNAAREIRRMAPSTKIILFSIHDIASIAAQAGADAFVSKTSTPNELVGAIERLTSSIVRPAAAGATPGSQAD